MAKKGPRSYPNTFWMILGTFKILTFFGPILGHFWARGPRISGFSYTKIPQKILESLWEHLGKYYFNFLELQKMSNLDPPNPYLFLIFFWNPPITQKRLVYIIVFEGHCP